MGGWGYRLMLLRSVWGGAAGSLGVLMLESWRQPRIPTLHTTFRGIVR